MKEEIEKRIEELKQWKKDNADLWIRGDENRDTYKSVCYRLDRLEIFYRDMYLDLK